MTSAQSAAAISLRARLPKPHGTSVMDGVLHLWWTHDRGAWDLDVEVFPDGRVEVLTSGTGVQVRLEAGDVDAAVVTARGFLAARGIRRPMEG